MTDTVSLVDRRQYLQGPHALLNGIDYVEVANPAETLLFVHFINVVPVAGTLTQVGSEPPVTITGGEVITKIAVLPIDQSTAWSVDSEGRPILTVQVASPGDFSTYSLNLSSPVVDPYFSSVEFSFKANCPSDFDCAPPVAPCPPEPALDVPIDYLAKDFSSFRLALSDFSTQRYPRWLERSEADLGMVLMELLAAVGDELSYYQDRVAGEAFIGTATQPLSLLRLARLVDYEPQPATVATVTLQVEVSVAGNLTTPVHCQALGADGTMVDFEVGGPLAAANGNLAIYSFPVDPRWNRLNSAGNPNLLPYCWDESQRCLEAGATRIDLAGAGHALYDKQTLLVDTAAPSTADPPAREEVVVAGTPVEMKDPLFGFDVTRVTLASPTTLDHDLTRTVLAGNLVPATQGLRYSDQFACSTASPPVGGSATAQPNPAVVRLAQNSTPDQPIATFRYSLASGALAWTIKPTDDADTPVSAIPEIVVFEVGAGQTLLPWHWVRWLLDATAADTVFSLTPEQYSPVLTSSGQTWFDYDGGEGTTIRFGDGHFGEIPAEGTSFAVTYRIGRGAVGDVPADTITRVVTDANTGPVVGCTNPFPASGGADAETAAQVRYSAPQAFQVPLRVVRPSDYEAAAKTLPWVRQAGTTFRWTGSWLTVFTAADPIDTELPTAEEVDKLTDLLNRRRLAGYESYVLPPRYVSIDLRLEVCGDPYYFASDIETAVLSVLRPGTLPDGSVGFFDHTRWSFGEPLESSALLTAIQDVTGVRGVSSVRYRQRGVQANWVPLPQTLLVAKDQILRVDDDPSRPDAGSLSVTVDGAK
jgi:predicted phage baseplate assembly protein